MNVPITEPQELGKFSLRVGPVLVEYSIPQGWLENFNKTWANWLSKDFSEDEPIAHKAQIQILEAESEEKVTRAPKLIVLKESHSGWTWHTDRRFFSEATWIDWRGLPADRRMHIDIGLRNVLASLSCENGHSALMHAATVALNGKAWLAPGESGRGKTTFFKALGGYEGSHLHEDLAFIWKGRAYSLPCKSSHTSWEMPMPMNLELGGFFELARGDELEVVRLNAPSAQLQTMSHSLVLPLRRVSHEETLQVLDYLIEISNHTKVYRLTFSLQHLKELVSTLTQINL